MTNVELLAAINTAIAEILLNGQTYAIGGRAHSRADLDTLRMMRKEIAPLADLEAASNCRVRNFARFDKPS